MLVYRIGRTGAAFATLALAALIGCGSGPKTYSVSGKIAVPGGDPSILAGSIVEAIHESDPNVRASGEIQPDGSFTLETLHAGVIQKGALGGTYQVRILLADDDPKLKEKAVRTISPKHFQFQTSGLTLQVPTEGNVQLTVSAK